MAADGSDFGQSLQESAGSVALVRVGPGGAGRVGKAAGRRRHVRPVAGEDEPSRGIADAFLRLRQALRRKGCAQPPVDQVQIQVPGLIGNSVAQDAQ
jgi:hypothetical protein